MSKPNRAALAILQVAQAELAHHIVEIPPHSNRGPRVELYQSHTWLKGTGWPWCIAFCQYANDEAGHPLPFKSAGAYDLLDRARRIGWASPDPAVGAVAVFNIGTGHGALVESFTKTTVTTIDGNVSDKVCRNTRPRNLVRGYVVQPVLRAPTSPPVPAKVLKKIVKPPHYEVVTSAQGTTRVVLSGRPLAQVVAALPRLFHARPQLTVRKTP